MKQPQGLKKRTGELIFGKSGEKLDRSPINVGDGVLLFHENGAEIAGNVSIIQEEDTYIVKVISTSDNVPGISEDDDIVIHKDFVFVVSKKT